MSAEVLDHRSNPGLQAQVTRALILSPARLQTRGAWDEEKDAPSAALVPRRIVIFVEELRRDPRLRAATVSHRCGGYATPGRVAVPPIATRTRAAQLPRPGTIERRRSGRRNSPRVSRGKAGVVPPRKVLRRLRRNRRSLPALRALCSSSARRVTWRPGRRRLRDRPRRRFRLP